MTNLHVDVAIVGAGTAGMTAYRAASAHTESLVMIESGAYGTTCARVGCMPSKLLIAAADAAHHVRQAELFGVHGGSPRIDGRAVMARVRAERDRFVSFPLATVEAWPASHRLRGAARFVGPLTLMIGGDTRLDARSVVIATGSAPHVPPGWREELGDRLLVNDDVFDWQTLPESLAVVGAGVIGVELAQALARLGVRVRLFGREGHVGAISDPVVRDAARALFAAEYAYHPFSEITEVASDGDGVRVVWQENAATHQDRFQYLLAATGRRPNLAGLGLEQAGLPLDERGVPVHDRATMQVGQTPVFVAGDAALGHPVLHEAADDGRIAGDNAARFPDVRPQPRRARMDVVFCDPQIARVGATFQELCDRRTPFGCGEVRFEGQGRSRVLGVNRGVLRVYGDHESGRLLGAEMVGPAAEHLAHLLAWALQCELTVREMLALPFYHPVIEEGLRTALGELNRNLRTGESGSFDVAACCPGA